MIPRVTIALSQFVKPVATGKSPSGSASGVGAASSQGGHTGQDTDPSGSQGEQSGQQAASSDSNNSKQHKDNEKDGANQATDLLQTSEVTAEKIPQKGVRKSANLRLVSPADHGESSADGSKAQDAGSGGPSDLSPIPEGQSVSHTFFQLFESIQNARGQVAGWLGNRVYLGPGKSGAKSKGRFKKGSMLDHKAS